MKKIVLDRDSRPFFSPYILSMSFPFSFFLGGGVFYYRFAYFVSVSLLLGLDWLICLLFVCLIIITIIIIIIIIIIIFYFLLHFEQRHKVGRGNRVVHF